LVGLVGCGGSERTAGLAASEVAALVRPGTPDAERWGAAVHDAIVALDRVPDRASVCQVLAVIEQESGYAADPAVPGLGAMARAELERKAEARLGWLGDDALDWLLEAGPEGEATFADRLDAVRTERDLDLVYRDLVEFHGDRVKPLRTAVEWVAPRLDDRHNPVRTAGSMQVDVGWAEAHRPKGMARDDVRDWLYTVEGGVALGTARLFAGADYEAAGVGGADAASLRFADFNAGVFASRNAAFQERVADLADVELALDGDLLAWSKRGRPRWRPDGATASALLSLVADGTLPLDEDRIRRDLKREKMDAFEDTATWEAVGRAWAERFGAPVEVARIPSIALDSPKLSGQWTTASFAQRTTRRYRACMGR
jgi:hypothetical protein